MMFLQRNCFVITIFLSFFTLMVALYAGCLPFLLRMSSGLGASNGFHSIAYVTVPSREVASTLAKNIVSKQLAACVNIIPSIQSVYKWEGNITEDEELLLMIKTRTSKIENLTKFVRENHPYDVPEVISVKIDQGNPAYLDWISKEVPE